MANNIILRKRNYECWLRHWLCGDDTIQVYKIKGIDKKRYFHRNHHDSHENKSPAACLE